MSLYSICKSVLSETGWPVAASIASNNEATAQQIFELANTELVALSELFSWPHLETEYTFNTVAAQATYLWPADFRVLTQQSVFDASQYYEVKGSCSTQDWHLRKNGLLGNISRKAFRLHYPLNTPAIELTPAPTGVESLVATYESKNLAYDPTNGNIGVLGYIRDTDVAKIPENYVKMGLKWRFRRAKGLDFSVEVAEYNATIKAQYAKYLSQAEIPIGGPRWNDDMPVTGGYVPSNGFG